MKNTSKGFTLIELLVVISIIGLLSSVVLASLNTARQKARDAKRRVELGELAKANELYFSDNGSYPVSGGWFVNGGHGGLDSALTPKYISKITDDQISGGWGRMYFTKDYTTAGYPCFPGGDPNRFGFYTKLEVPSASDLATISDVFDRCVRDSFGMNYKAGN